MSCGGAREVEVGIHFADTESGAFAGHHRISLETGVLQNRRRREDSKAWMGLVWELLELLADDIC